MSKFRVLLLISAMSLSACQGTANAPPAAEVAPPMPQPASPPAEAMPTPQAGTTTANSTETTPVPGQKWHVMTFTCDQLIGLADDDRAAAMMFYYGYLAARSNFHEIDTSRIEGNVRRVLDRCAKKRNLTVAEAFREELGPRVKTSAN